MKPANRKDLLAGLFLLLLLAGYGFLFYQGSVALHHWLGNP